MIIHDVYHVSTGNKSLAFSVCKNDTATGSGPCVIDMVMMQQASPGQYESGIQAAIGFITRKHIYHNTFSVSCLLHIRDGGVFCMFESKGVMRIIGC